MLFLRQYDEEIFSEYNEWIPYVIDIYSPIRDSETGDFRHLPFPGSLMEQPYKSFMILKCIQNSYREVVEEKQKQMMQKSKTK